MRRNTEKYPEHRIIRRHSQVDERTLSGRIIIVREDVVRFYPSVDDGAGYDTSVIHDATYMHFAAWESFPEFRIFEICYYGLGIREWMERRAKVSNPEDYFNVFMEVIKDYIRQGKLSGNLNEQ